MNKSDLILQLLAEAIMAKFEGDNFTLFKKIEEIATLTEKSVTRDNLFKQMLASKSERKEFYIELMQEFELYLIK